MYNQKYSDHQQFVNSIKSIILLLMLISIEGGVKFKNRVFHSLGVLNGAPICTKNLTTFIFGNKYLEPPCQYPSKINPIYKGKILPF